MGGQPVSGQVIFVGADNKESASPIDASGNYQIVNPSKGEVTILVKSLGAPAAKGTKTDLGAGPAAGGGVAPPAKYAQANNGLPKLTISGADQTHDIELKP